MITPYAKSPKLCKSRAYEHKDPTSCQSLGKFPPNSDLIVFPIAPRVLWARMFNGNQHFGYKTAVVAGNAGARHRPNPSVLYSRKLADGGPAAEMGSSPGCGRSAR